MVELLVVTQVGHPNRGAVTHIQIPTGVWGRKEDVRQWVKEGNTRGSFPGVHSVINADITLVQAKVYKLQFTENNNPSDPSDAVLIEPRLRIMEVDRIDTVGGTTDPDGTKRITKANADDLMRNLRTGKLDSDP